MKKLLLSALAICAFTFGNAQEDKKETTGGFAKGDFFLSGNVGFNSEKTGDVKMNSFSFSPEAGFFVSDNIAVGLDLGIGSSTDDNGTTETKMTPISIGAFGRYYFTPASRFSIFAELGVDFTSTKTEVTTGGVSTDSTTGSFGIGVTPNISYFVSNNFALQAGFGSLGYRTNDNGGDGAESTDTFRLNLDLDSINFGLLYKF